MKEEIVFATNNSHKLSEVQQILGKHFKVLSSKDVNCLEDIEETGKTLEENAFIKARYIKENYHHNCFADDTGLEVEALNGAPGVYSARYATNGHDFEANINKLLKELDGVENRKAQFRTVVALIINAKEYQFEGVIKGKIIDERKGTTGFGYDPIFVPDGYDKTFAELGDEIKNEISHRAIAVKKLADFLLIKNK